MPSVAIDGRMWGSGFTGIGYYVREVATRLFYLLPEVSFTLFLPPNISEDLSFSENVRILLAPEPIYSCAEQWSFFRHIRSVHADITWFPHCNVPFLFRSPFLVTIHDLTLMRYPGKKMGNWYQRFAFQKVFSHALQHSSGILSVSEYTKKDLLSFLPLSSEKISVTPLGIDMKRYQSPNPEKIAEFKNRFTSPFFLVSGVWREHKNVPGAITAFEMYRKYGGKGSLVITGKPDPFYNEVRLMAESSPFSKNIFLTGFLPENDMPALFSAADALLFPSFSEGFGLPVLEAMSAGTPVCASNATSLPEVCGDAALFFRPGNYEEMALAMVDVLQEKTRNRLVAEGRKRATLFSWDTTAQKTGEALRPFLSSVL
ncbi:glycosyltransferase family 4 protein [Candidatus Peregrinibacteria bacterium]|nr:MAG: glycosyltransferase family 4 protein [Candidatus Peregrinibacteria bacterium]